MPKLPSDPRVKDIVEARLAEENIDWLQHLQSCPAGARHKVRSSYGHSQWAHVGNVYEIVSQTVSNPVGAHDPQSLPLSALRSLTAIVIVPC